MDRQQNPLDLTLDFYGWKTRPAAIRASYCNPIIDARLNSRS